jgi:hypothetical protein
MAGHDRGRWNRENTKTTMAATHERTAGNGLGEPDQPSEHDDGGRIRQ